MTLNDTIFRLMKKIRLRECLCILFGLVVGALGTYLVFTSQAEAPLKENLSQTDSSESLLALSDLMHKKSPCADCELFPGSTYNSFYSFGYGDDDGSVAGVAKRQSDGSFVLLYTGQSAPDCEQVAKYHVPNQIEPSCWNSNGKLVPNTY